MCVCGVQGDSSNTVKRVCCVFTSECADNNERYVLGWGFAGGREGKCVVVGDATLAAGVGVLPIYL